MPDLEIGFSVEHEDPDSEAHQQRTDNAIDERFHGANQDFFNSLFHLGWSDRSGRGKAYGEMPRLFDSDEFLVNTSGSASSSPRAPKNQDRSSVA